jgi:hypothetical protein
MGNPNTTTPTYHAGGNDFYNRGMPYLPNIDTKSTVYPENWIIPNSEETSPVETYGLDQSTPYVSTQSTLSNVYGPSHQWNGSSLRNSPTGVHTYLGQEAASSYTTSNVPNIQPGINRTSTEALSPLNMTSISSALPSSLPERPHPRQSRVMDSNVPQRQLPVPQPSPAQSTRNTVDMLQDQRLRSAQITNGNSMSLNSSSAKPPITWPTDTSMPGSDSQSIASSEASSTGHLPQASTATPVTDLTGLSVLASATTMGTKNSTTLSTQPALNFSTSTLLDTISVPSSTYSNFRNYALPTSSSTDPIHVLTQKSSESNLYRFSGDSMMKRRSLGDNSDGPSLISGHRYTPLGAPPPPSSSMGRDSVENRQQEPLHRASMSNQKRTH